VTNSGEALLGGVGPRSRTSGRPCRGGSEAQMARRRESSSELGHEWVYLGWAR
jgi:hypothetical protein